MYICPDCDYTVEKIQTGKEFRQNQYGSSDPVNASDCSCPKCGDVMLEAAECKICETVYKTEELHEGICPECLPDEFDKNTFAMKSARMINQKQANEITRLEADNARLKQAITEFSTWAQETLNSPLFGGDGEK